MGTYNFTYLNFVKINYWELELGVEYFVNDALSFFDSLTWLGQVYRNQQAIANSDFTAHWRSIPPDTKVKQGVTNFPDKGFY